MSTKLYNPLLDAIIQNASPAGSGRVYHVAINGEVKLETIKNGIIKAKSEYVKRKKLSKQWQLIFLDSCDFELPKNFRGFSVTFKVINRTDVQDI